MMDKDKELKAMMVESIEKAKAINPDPETNPGQTLEQYYDFIEWSGKCLPREVINQYAGRTLFNKLDQSLCYAYSVFDQLSKQPEFAPANDLWHGLDTQILFTPSNHVCYVRKTAVF